MLLVSPFPSVIVYFVYYINVPDSDDEPEDAPRASPPSTSHTSNLTTPASNTLSKSAAGSKADAGSPPSSKCRSAVSSKPSSSRQPSRRGDFDAALTNIQSSINRLLDVISQSIVATTQGAIQTAVGMVNGVQGNEDELSPTERLFLIRLVSHQPNKASAYLAQQYSYTRRIWIRLELLPFRDEMDRFDAEQDAMDVADDVEKD